VAIVFKDLKKLVWHSQQQNKSKELFERLKDKPFWIWDKQQHKLEDIRTDGDCCFNHIIGLPTKEGVEKPLFDYEKILYGSILVNEATNHNNSKDCLNQSYMLLLIVKKQYWSKWLQHRSLSIKSYICIQSTR
jgi:hypothetical protein